MALGGHDLADFGARAVRECRGHSGHQLHRVARADDGDRGLPLCKMIKAIRDEGFPPDFFDDRLGGCVGLNLPPEEGVRTTPARSADRQDRGWGPPQKHRGRGGGGCSLSTWICPTGSYKSCRSSKPGYTSLSGNYVSERKKGLKLCPLGWPREDIAIRGKRS